MGVFFLGFAVGVFFLGFAVGVFFLGFGDEVDLRRRRDTHRPLSLRFCFGVHFLRQRRGFVRRRVYPDLQGLREDFFFGLLLLRLRVTQRLDG